MFQILFFQDSGVKKAAGIATDKPVKIGDATYAGAMNIIVYFISNRICLWLLAFRRIKYLQNSIPQKYSSVSEWSLQHRINLLTAVQAD